MSRRITMRDTKIDPRLLGHDDEKSSATFVRDTNRHLLEIPVGALATVALCVEDLCHFVCRQLSVDLPWTWGTRPARSAPNKPLGLKMRPVFYSTQPWPLRLFEGPRPKRRRHQPTHCVGCKQNCVRIGEVDQRLVASVQSVIATTRELLSDVA